MLGNTLPTFRDWLGAVSKGFSKEAYFKGLDTLATTVAENTKSTILLGSVFAEKMHEKEVRK